MPFKPFAEMTPAERAHYVEEKGRDLVVLAEMLGVSLRIDRVPLRPLAMGGARHEVVTWPSRHQQQALCAPAAPQRREISDREWAAQPAGLREGCTTHVPGVGDL